ncbi:hypothetical protein WR25_23649 [Diploscapter pachys]|uniref:Uncharacterized protein n=1 Tax=Diploscapter pachys TaxID=2018661 RepID=A0A2A2KAU0_9BILA|nr:hypothetical protein WR25_23649 [Diploscapter pachys]
MDAKGSQRLVARAEQRVALQQLATGGMADQGDVFKVWKSMTIGKVGEKVVEHGKCRDAGTSGHGLVALQPLAFHPQGRSGRCLGIVFAEEAGGQQQCVVLGESRIAEQGQAAAIVVVGITVHAMEHDHCMLDWQAGVEPGIGIGEERVGHRLAQRHRLHGVAGPRGPGQAGEQHQQCPIAGT